MDSFAEFGIIEEWGSILRRENNMHVDLYKRLTHRPVLRDAYQYDDSTRRGHSYLTNKYNVPFAIPPNVPFVIPPPMSPGDSPFVIPLWTYLSESYPNNIPMRERLPNYDAFHSGDVCWQSDGQGCPSYFSVPLCRRASMIRT